MRQFYTSQLNPQAKQFATILMQQARMGGQPLYALGTATDPPNALNDALLAVQAVKLDRPEYFWLGHHWSARSVTRRRECRVEIYDEFRYPAKDCLPLVRAAKQEAMAIVRSICSRAERPADREELLFDYLYSVPYGDPENLQSHNILGLFLDKSAVCEGKAASFTYLTGLMGIESIVIYGQGKRSSHAWNGVWLDRKFLELDCTWGPRYFNLPSHQMGATHTPDPKFHLPKEVNYGSLHTRTHRPA